MTYSAPQTCCQTFPNTACVEKPQRTARYERSSAVEKARIWTFNLLKTQRLAQWMISLAPLHWGAFKTQDHCCWWETLKKLHFVFLSKCRCCRLKWWWWLVSAIRPMAKKKQTQNKTKIPHCDQHRVGTWGPLGMRVQQLVLAMQNQVATAATGGFELSAVLQPTSPLVAVQSFIPVFFNP